MKIKVSDYLIKRLAGLGITDIFGLPGIIILIYLIL